MDAIKFPLFKGKIKKAVMAVIERRIADAQKNYEQDVKNLDLNHKQVIKQMETDLEGNKDKLVSTYVQEILGKVL